MKRPRANAVDREALLLRIAGASIVAGIIHGGVTPDHFAQWWGYGLFFLLASLAQTFFGAIPLFARLVEGEPITTLWSRGKLRTYAWMGIVGNAMIVTLYVVTRTVGIPFFGPEAGVVEEVRGIDVVTKLIEVGIIMGLAVFLQKRPRAAPSG